MSFHLIHVDDDVRSDEHEEAYVLMPGAAKTAIAVPIDALPGFMPVLAESVNGLPAQRCPDCGEPISDHGGDAAA